MVKFLTAGQIVAIHKDMLEFGGTKGFRYEGGIYFIAEKAKLRRTLEKAAATYLYEIIVLEVDLEEGKQFTLNIAKGDVDFFEVVRWVKAHMRPIV
jgi:hypothetical protein